MLNSSVSLARVVHARDGHVQRAVDTYLVAASEVFFLYDENVPSQLRSEDEGAGGYSGPGLSTTHDVVWPLIFCAVFEKSIRLSVQPSAHTAHLLESEAWSRGPALQQW